MSHSVIISLSNTSHSPKEVAFVQGLLHNLAARHIDTFMDEPATLADGMNRQAITTQWLVLVLTPEAIRSAQVRALVKTAFDSVKRGQMRGVVAVTFLSDQIEPDDLPDLWDTIRIYYISESSEDQRLAFNKIACLAGPLTPVRTTSSAVNDWTSSSTSQNLASHNQVNSRALPVARSKPAQKSYFRLMALASMFTLVVGLILGVFALSFFQDHFPHEVTTPKPNLLATHTAQATTARVSKTATAQFHAAATAQAKDADALSKRQAALTNLPNDPQTFYNLIMKAPDSPVDLSMTEQEGPQGNTSNGCTPKNKQYQLSTTTNPAMVCQAEKTSFVDFVYQARVTINKGNAGGLIFLSDGAQNYYRLSLKSDGHYALYACQTELCSPLIITSGNLVGGEEVLPNNKLPIAGKPELLTIIVHDSTIYFYIEGTCVNHWKDNNSVGIGQEIGLFAVSDPSLTLNAAPTPVTFSNVKVWDISYLTNTR